MSASVIQRLYQKHKVKYKKVRQQRTSWKESTVNQKEEKLKEMQRDLRYFDDGGKCEIFQIDEIVFVGSDLIRRAFSH